MPELTPELIADLRFPNELAVAPNGRHVVYTLAALSKTEEHHQNALWLADLEGSTPPRPFTAGSANDHAPQWSPDGTSIAFLSDRAKRGVDQLYLIGLAGGEARALTPAANKRPVLSFAWSPDGSGIAFTSADEPSEDDERREKERDDAQVYGERWPFARLRLLTLADARISTLVSGERHVRLLAWSPQGDALAYASSATPELASWEQEMHLERISRNGGESRLVAHVPGLAGDLIWTADGVSLLFIAPSDGKAQTAHAVWRVAASGGTAVRLALGEATCAMRLKVLQAAQRPLVSIANGLTSQLAWLNSNSGELDIFLSSGEGDAASAWFDYIVGLGDEHLAVVVSGATSTVPWELWAGTGVCPAMRQLSTHQAALADISWGSQEPFTWTAPDGLELDGLLLRPPAAPPGPLPTVVLAHGGPYSRWVPGCQLSWGNWGQWLATAGYAVLMPNPRGGSGHGAAFAQAARADVGGKDYGDVMAAVDAAIERGITDPARLAIGGWSQGGFMSAWAITQSDRFTAAIVGAGPTDWGMMAATSDVPTFEAALGGSTPWEGAGPHRHAALSPLSFARKCRTPTLILHGQHDVRVPLNQAIAFHRALRETGTAVELVVYPREPHAIQERLHQIDLLKRVRAWCDRWLRA